MKVSEQIRKYRKGKMTQKELAERLNKSERMIQKYESGEVTPSIDILNNIAAALGVSVNDLIKDDVIDISVMNGEQKEAYFELIIEKPELKPLADIFKNKGYVLSQEVKGSNIYLIKNGKVIAYISEKDFIDFGVPAINSINEFVDFQFNKLEDIFTILS